MEPLAQWLDHLACRAGIWALTRLFTPCGEPQANEIHMPHCIGCDSARLVRLMRKRMGQ